LGDSVFYGQPLAGIEKNIMQDRINLSIENQVAHVELNRPEKRNALDMAMFRAIAGVQKKLRRERKLRAVILGGAGVDFCSGLDVKALMKDRMGMLKLLWKWHPWRANLAQVVSTGWRNLPVPVIAAIHGRCWGGGLQIALGADFRLVKPDASVSVMEGKWGLIPDMGGTLALREITGRDHAMWLSMSAQVFDGSHALELGLATALSDDPLSGARAMAAELTDRSPDAVAAVKRLYRKSWTSRPGTVLARETGYQIRVLAGRNQRIAVGRQMGSDRKFRDRGRW
jgi:enoyl-CoA hydratase/carnithine racemase